MQKISIVCACDDSYSQHAMAMITSVFENNKGNSIDVYILTDNFSDQTQKYFDELSVLYNNKIQIVNIDISLLAHLTLGGKYYQGYINLSTYYRLLIVKLFPTLDKILYLDCDMIVRGNLSPLWNTNIENYAIAGIVDTWSKVQEGTFRLHYPKEQLYYNAGMGLYNLAFLRDFGFDNKVQNFVKEHYDWILLHDQDILNAVLHGHFKEVSLEWNVMNNAIIRKCDISPNQKKDFAKTLDSIKIIHYTGPLKPWHKECYHPLKKDYWHYLNMSPMKGRHTVSRYESYKDKIHFLKCNWRAYLGMSSLSFIKIK